LGLGKINSSVVQKDNPAIRGMTRIVRHLIKVEPIEQNETVEVSAKVKPQPKGDA
jgi:hypothetical protein